MPVVFIGFPASAILAMNFGVALGVWTAYFSIINAASHVGMFLRRGYNPGFAVSATLNIPVGLFTLWYVVSNGLVSVQAHLVGLAIALGVQGGLMLYGFLVLKPKIL